MTLIAAALVCAGMSSVRDSQAEDYTTPDDSCVVDLVDDLELHATEAGILDHVAVKEGARVRTEDVLVRIDTREPEKLREIAKLKLRASIERARADIEERYSKAAADVAAATVLELEETNRSVPKAVTEADLRQARLDHRRSILGIEKAIHDRKMAEFDAWTLKAELEATEMAIERRTLRAPFNGVVIKSLRDEKEWVNPGDPILRLVRLDELQVEGFVPVAQHTPAELDGCEVTIDVKVGQRTVKATGRIVYINPILFRGQKVAVRAEVTNREEQGHWVILPKMKATMTIHLGTGGVAAARRGAGTRVQGPGELDGRR